MINSINVKSEEIESDYSRNLDLSKDVTFLNKVPAEIKVTEKLNVGDVIKIKNYKNLIKIKYVDYKISDSASVDYAGNLIEFKTNRLVLFNQKDIESVIRYGGDSKGI